MKRFWAIFLCMILTLGLLSGCKAKDAVSKPKKSEDAPKVEPYEAVKTYWKDEQLTQSWPKTEAVEHIFFHPVIAYPQWAFHDCKISTAQRNGLDDWMLTAEEYKKILNALYEKDYILVAIEDVWHEEDGRMVRSDLQLPEGKKPLIFSFDDVNYYDYMLAQGFTSKLTLGKDGEIWAECTDPYTGETSLTQDLDAVTILDRFVLDHPDFSLNGAKAILSLTGYQGILGYRTQNDRDIAPDSPDRPAFEAFRDGEIKAVRPIIKRLKETGWTFGSHTWGHINLANKPFSYIVRDTERWAEEVGSLVGETDILFYPHGARPDGNDWKKTGETFTYLQEQGFRVFCSVGTSSFTAIKPDICAVICDRLHPDGTTLRRARDKYLKFYDAKDIIDLSVRPDLGVKW